MNRRDLLRGAGSAVFGHSSRRLRQLDKHRNLFTGDSCVYFYNPELWQPEGLPYTARAIHRYVDLLADSGVDTFLSNPNAQVAWYPSKRLETILDGYRRGDRDFFRAHARATHVPPEQLDAFLDNMVRFHNLYLDLAEAGVDWLAETVKACRRRQIAPWVSVRMNDTHGVEDAASHFNCKAFRDPANRLGGRAIDPADPPNAHWVALNYARKPVRDFMFSHIREYLENYGFEGLELDWLRDPHILEPGATEADCRLVTSWLKDVRAFADSRARITGKPLPLGLRIPANLGYLRSRGLDVQAIVRDGLVDFIGFSNFWQTSWDIPYEQLRAELGPDVVFHGVVEDAPNWIPGHAPDMASNTGQAPYPNPGVRYMSASAPMLRANAAGKLSMGVHGIEQFNFFCTDQVKIPGLRADYGALRGIHDLSALRGKEKHYCLSSPSGRLSMLWETPEQIPAVIEPRNRREFRLTMCDEQAGGTLRVQVALENPPGATRLGLSLNGAWPTFESRQTRDMLFPAGPYTRFAAPVTAWEFKFDSSVIRQGWNFVTVLNNSRNPAGAVKVVSVELGVSFA
ncbi:MAG: hypothetical protein IT167_13155 [Bryobacterales bacterium]|nr:hypothetical protein [Bryobacterales bacterium]